MFRFLKRNDSEVITPEVVDVPVMTIQSNIAMALALCMEEYLRSVSKTSLKKYIESHNHIVIGPDTEGTLRLSSIINKNPGLPADVKGFSYPNIVSFDAVKIGRNELFVACPPGQLNNPEVTITKKAVETLLCTSLVLTVFSFTVCGEKSQRTRCLKNINVLTI